MKERAHRAKMKNRDVVFISLASSDRFGQPLEYCGVYDLITKREMNSQSITFMSRQDLNQFVNSTQPSSANDRIDNSKNIANQEDNRMFVMETLRTNKYNDLEKLDLVEKKNIDWANAVAYYNEQIIKILKTQQAPIVNVLEDVYESLKQFIKKYKDHDIFIDELLVLLSVTSKIFNSVNT